MDVPTRAPYAEVAALLRRHLPANEDAVRRLVDRCREADPAATTGEICHFLDLKIAQHARLSSVQNPIGLLIESVPKCFSGAMIQEYREQVRRHQEQGREEARRVLQDPEATDSERDTARSILGDES
jgi:hypothetical protein